MSWLKLVAPRNLQGCMSALEHTSARPRIGTSGKCSTHIWYIVVTLEVSHTEMSWLKLVTS